MDKKALLEQLIRIVDEAKAGCDDNTPRRSLRAPDGLPWTALLHDLHPYIRREEEGYFTLVVTPIDDRTMCMHATDSELLARWLISRLAGHAGQIVRQRLHSMLQGRIIHSGVGYIDIGAETLTIAGFELRLGAVQADHEVF